MNPTPQTPAASGASFASRLLPAPRGLLRSLALLLAFAATAAVSPAAYLWVSGHGLTGKSGNSESVADLIKMCRTNPNDPSTRLPWMRIIEKEYPWISLEGPDADQYHVNQIVTDAVACKDAGMYLRVMILHKYTDYPSNMDDPDPTKDGPHTAWIGGTSSIIKLNQDSTYNRLTALYTKVIAALRNNANAKAAFYGFVLQETSISDGGTYFGKDGQTDATQQQRRDAWFVNLRKFHNWLNDDARLGLFADVEPRGRIFWQMINTPDEEIDNILAQNLKGMGLDGPDTFPREPSNGGPTATTVLYRSYETMRQMKGVFPIALHVYAGNYRHDRPHQNASMIPGIVPLWKGGDTLAVNGYDNLDAGDGLFNFLGVAGNIGTANWQIGNRPDHMDVHNVIWSTAEGNLKQFDGDPVEKNAAGIYIEAGETAPGSGVSMPFGHYGWSKVKAEMQSGNGKFVANWNGGCNNTKPSGVQ